MKQAPQIIVECQGVGYEVETPMSTFLDLPNIGEDLFLYTHLLVRDDAHMLFGFASEAERHLFRALLKISGVGAKMGLAILSTMKVDDFERCVEYEDAATLVKIPGVGKKTAERLIIGSTERTQRPMLRQFRRKPIHVPRLWTHLSRSVTRSRRLTS
jgi:Holliday junction DNA helicase RuvA